MTEDRVPHPECIEAYHGRLLLTGRTIMSVSRVRGLVAASEQPAPPLDVDALIADMPVATLATDGGPALAYAMRVEAYLRARLGSAATQLLPDEPES